MASQADKVLFKAYAYSERENERMKTLFELLEDTEGIGTYEEFRSHLKRLVKESHARKEEKDDE